MTRKDRMYEDLAQNKYYDVKVGFVTFQAFVIWFLGAMIVNLAIAYILPFPFNLLFFFGCIAFLRRKWTKLKEDADEVKAKVEEIRETDP